MSTDPEGKSRLRRVGPGDQGGQVTIRVGDQLEVAPAGAGPWQLTTYPKEILRLQGGDGPTDSVTFLAIAVGDGQVSLATAAGGPAFTVRVRVLRDMVQDPAP
jgi:hypothetical protein